MSSCGHQDGAAIIFTSGHEGEEIIYSIGVLPNQKPTDQPVLHTLAWKGEYGDLRVTQAKVGEGNVQVIATRMLVSAPNELISINAGMLGHQFFDVTEFKDRSYRDPTQTGELVEVDEAHNDQEKQITQVNTALIRQLSLSPLGYFWFTGAEGTRVQAFLVKPPNFDPTKKYPVKFLIHGGPQGAWGDAWSYRWNPELMAASGYVVVMVNPRGSTGYGQAFIDGVNGDWGGKPYIDLMKGLDAAEAQFPFLDKTRECALGASYGGFMANWVLDPHQPLRLHRHARRHVQPGRGLRRHGRNVVQRVGVPAHDARWQARPEPCAAVALRQPAGRPGPLPQVVAHAAHSGREDADAGQSIRSATIASMCPKACQLFTALQRLNVPSEMLYFLRRRPLGAEAAELAAVEQDRRRLVRPVDPHERLRGQIAWPSHVQIQRVPGYVSQSARQSCSTTPSARWRGACAPSATCAG